MSGGEKEAMAEVKEWLAKTFEGAGKSVPEFEYTPRSVKHLNHLMTLSKAKDEAARLVARDFRLKSSEYRSQAARIREILENLGLAQESLPSNVVTSAQVLANVANLLNIRDTEMSSLNIELTLESVFSFLVAMGDISLRKTEVEEKRAEVNKESKLLLDYTRKAIARLTYLKRTLAQLEDEVAPCEAQKESWETNLQVMAAKERQYNQQCDNYKRMLDRSGYNPEVSHGILVEMAEHRKELEKKTKPILDTLRSYQDLPPDKALAALAIEDKKRQYADAEKYLEDVLQSALASSE
ncbi:AUGMIN subunit 1 [Glycine soja]